MLFYLLAPVAAFLTIVLQKTLLDLVFVGKIGMQVSLILVVFAAFRLEPLKAGFFTFVTGFLFDCLSGSVVGVYTFYYVLVHLMSSLVAGRMYGEHMVFVMIFTFFCVMLEGFYVVALYRSVFDVDMSYNLYRVFFPQALVAGVLSPALFWGLQSVEAWVYAGDQ